jgi:hypothetical protein
MPYCLIRRILTIIIIATTTFASADPLAQEPASNTSTPSESAPAAPKLEEMGDALRPIPRSAYDRRGRLKRKVTPVEGYDAPPSPYHSVQRPQRRYWITGTAILGGTWLLATGNGLLGYAFAGDFFGSQDETYLLGALPVVGPIVSAGVHLGEGRFDGFDAFGLVMSAAQVGGAAALIIGLTSTEEVWILEPSSVDSVSLALTVSPSLTGLAGVF